MLHPGILEKEIKGLLAIKEWTNKKYKSQDLVGG
jgi:hypothetical protein